MTYRDTASMRLLASLPSPLASPEDCAIVRVDVERIVGRLPERERAVVEARMLGERGRTLRETADVLGLTESVVASRERRAVWRLAWLATMPGWAVAGDGQDGAGRWRRLLLLIREVRG